MVTLEDYKSLLDRNTFDGLGYEDEVKSRYHSFKYCLDYLNTLDQPEVLEIGTTRSYVGGAFEGCNSNDVKYWDKNDFNKWDFGAGAFTLVSGQLLNNKCNLTTLDLISDHIKRCKTMTDSLGIKCQHIVSDSVSYLKTTNKKYDLIYADSGDMTPISPSIQLQKAEMEMIVQRQLLKPGGLILIDDVLNKTPRDYGEVNNTLGKSQEAIPYLLSQGYNCVFEGYQYIFKTQ